MKYKLLRNSMLLLAVVSMTGCGLINKEEKLDYESLYSEASSALKAKEIEYNNLKDVLSAYDEKYKEMTGISRFTYLQNGEKTFITINDQLILDNGIQLGYSEPLANGAKISLTDSIAISPSDTWTIKTTTANTQLYSDNGITGTIELCTTTEAIDTNFMYDTYFSDFAGYNGLTNESRKTLFIGSSMSGIEVSWRVNITDNVYGTDKRMIPNKNILSSEELESLQAIADESVAESESARMEEYLSTLESTEPQTDESGETIPPETLPETLAHAEDVGELQAEVILPSTVQETYPATLKIGLVMFGDKALIYKLLYKNDGSSTNEELTNTVIKSITVDGINLAFDK